MKTISVHCLLCNIHIVDNKESTFDITILYISFIFQRETPVCLKSELLFNFHF